MGRFAEIISRIVAGEPAAILAPMAGVTDVGMRTAAQHLGATFVVSEMVDSRFYNKGEGLSASRVRRGAIACHIVQIAGCTRDGLADAARRAEGEGADAIDINMGCPAKKVVGGAAGSALMRDLDHATSLIGAVRSAVRVPVTVKMRLGWDDASRNAPELARRAEAEGVSLVSVHGRTRAQFYGGVADWAAIRAVVESVGIPVIANGDCVGEADARAMLTASGAAGVMIGRAAIGRPWLVGEIADALVGAERVSLPMARRRDVALDHYDSIIAEFGAARGVRHARKHLAGYARHAGHPAESEAHHRLVTAEDHAEARKLLAEIFQPVSSALRDLAA